MCPNFLLEGWKTGLGRRKDSHLRLRLQSESLMGSEDVWVRPGQSWSMSWPLLSLEGRVMGMRGGGERAENDNAVLTHFSLAGGLDLEGLCNGLGGSTQWVVAPGHLALQRPAHRLPHKKPGWLLAASKQSHPGLHTLLPLCLNLRPLHRLNHQSVSQPPCAPSPPCEPTQLLPSLRLLP